MCNFSPSLFHETDPCWLCTFLPTCISGRVCVCWVGRIKKRKLFFPWQETWGSVIYSRRWDKTIVNVSRRGYFMLHVDRIICHQSVWYPCKSTRALIETPMPLMHVWNFFQGCGNTFDRIRETLCIVRKVLFLAIYKQISQEKERHSVSLWQGRTGCHKKLQKVLFVINSDSKNPFHDSPVLASML